MAEKEVTEATKKAESSKKTSEKTSAKTSEKTGAKTTAATKSNVKPAIASAEKADDTPPATKSNIKSPQTKVSENITAVADNVQIIDPTKALKEAAQYGNIPGLKTKTEMDPAKKKTLLSAIIGGGAALVVVLLVIILFVSGVFSPNLAGFGDTKALAGLSDKVIGTGAELELDPTLLDGVSLTESSGVVFKEGDGEVAEVGKQANFNYKLYANVSDEMMQGQQGGTPHWQSVQSSWDSNESFPVQITEKTSDSDLSSALGGSDSSSQQTDPTVQYFNNVLSGQKVGTIFGVYIKPAAASAAQGQPDMFILGELDFVGDAGSTPDAPEVSTEVPENAPTFTFDAAGAPSGIDVPEDFTGTDNIVVNVLSEGTGAEVKSSDTVSAKYAGYLLDGTQFDSSFTKGNDPVSFPLSGVIKGWSYGLVGQNIGSKVELLIPAQFGYGAKGNEKIPGDSFLVFYVEIVDAKATSTQDSSQSAEME